MSVSLGTSKACEVRRRLLTEGTRIARWIIPLGPLLLPVALSGCGLAAAPCRVTTAGIDIVPVVGHPLGTPTRYCANTIDPGG